ncbi:GDSL lipase/acylhydrolase [Stereum hirsutum FP-91666 SS1]|uniref:GDSL lipase/acylhydrolase n=1 Tax=Stereum hirsutum (strain FP-91666) TaxID=721885 RepID=UPI0004449244|nr:GDSL lipase/acylhydrolase [Stereum hirsutum FP-91666 SS1]EIM83790.1 GDSL lipase/acylhydrolase [Stereum hirsutum FP-91666 SS1]
MSELAAAYLLASLPNALAKGIPPNAIQNLVTFGDSYTDIVNVFDGGAPWPIYLADYANLTLFAFAQAGAVCDQNLTPRSAFPAVVQNQIPEYLDALAAGNITGDANSTLFTQWIGTNDVGQLLTGAQTGEATVVDTVACAVEWVKTMYDGGARNFLFQNMVPLERTILYSNDSYPNRYWTQERNTTEWSLFMRELTGSGNEIAKFMLKTLAPTLPNAHIGLFDSHGLFNDILNNPSSYLNGTAPLNTTGAVRSCIFQEFESTSATGNCTIANGTDADSFAWFDELHPSEQSDRIVARQIANLIQGVGNNWTTWFS